MSVCWICHESDGELAKCCSCTGELSLAHVGCLVPWAENHRWCPMCADVYAVPSPRDYATAYWRSLSMQTRICAALWLVLWPLMALCVILLLQKRTVDFEVSLFSAALATCFTGIIVVIVGGLQQFFLMSWRDKVLTVATLFWLFGDGFPLGKPIKVANWILLTGLILL